MNHVANPGGGVGGGMCVHVGIHMMKRWRGGARDMRPPVNKRKLLATFASNWNVWKSLSKPLTESCS